MQYQEHPASPQVDRFVRCFWSLQGGLPASASTGARSVDEAAEPALPDGSPELIFNLGEPFEHIPADGRAKRQPQAFLVGQITGPMVVRPTGPVDLIAVRFEAHGAALLSDDLGALTDRWVDVQKLKDRAVTTLKERLEGVETTDGRIALITDWLARRATQVAGPDPRVEVAVRAIRSSHGAVNLDDLCRQLRLTPRSLQRLFKLQVGISPKLLARIVRFQRIFAAWRSDPSTLSRVAAECGYFDQPHMIRDFRQFAGAPPASFLAALPQFTEFFLEGSRKRGKR